MYYGYIYLIKDQRNNKIYIGQKKGKIEDSQDYYGSGVTINQIINNQGTYFLKKIILGVCSSKEELDLSEEESIWLFRSYGADGIHHDNIYGYNLTPKSFGGNINGNHPNKKHIYKKCVETWYNKSEEEKQQIGKKRSDAQKKNYQENPERSKQLSELLLEINKNNPEISEQKSNKMIQWYIDNPEERLKRGEETKEKWKDPSYRECQINRQLKRWENKENRIKQGKITKQRYINNPEDRIKQSNTMKQRYIDHPEEREKQSKRFSGKNSSSYKEVNTLKILQLSKEGKTPVEISKLMNISYGIVKRRLKNPEKYL